MILQNIIENTISKINPLLTEKAKEVSDFAELLLSRYEDKELTRGIQKMISERKSFEFLHQEEELYNLNDLKKINNG